MGLVLITIDSLRLDDMAHIDLPGAQVFPCVSCAPITSVACASILTGLYPPRHGLRNLTGYSLRKDVTTLAEIFKAAGYSTHAVVSGPPLKKFSGLARGFDTYDDDFEGFKRPYNMVLTAAPWLDKYKETLFLWLHFFDLHPPFHVNDNSLKGVFNARHTTLKHIAKAIWGLADRLPHHFIVTSDHGEGFCRRVLNPAMWLGHGERLDDVDVNVPLFLSGFNDCWHPWALRQVDILPTICREFELPIPEGIDGVAAQDQTEELWAYSETCLRPYRHFPDIRSVRRGIHLLSIGANSISCRGTEKLDEMTSILADIWQPPSEGTAGDGLAVDEKNVLQEHLKALGYM